MIALVALWIVRGSAVYHLVMGLASLGPPSMVRALTLRLYALQMPDVLDPRYEYTLKPLGAFAVFLSLCCARAGFFAGLEELRFFELALAVLFALRAFARVAYRSLLLKAFGVSWQRSRVNVLFNLGLALILLGAAV